MKPAAFDYVAARSVEEATALLAEGGGEARLLAGGQSLVPLLNFRLIEPARLIDITRLRALDHVTETEDGLRIGALTRHRTIETSPVLRRHLPIVAHAMTQVGHLAIRNRGTAGGSLCHADPAAEWPMLALLLDARITALSHQGRRAIAARDFFRGPLSTALAPAEMVSEIEIPALPAGAAWGFEKLSRRAGDFALCAAGVVLAAANGRCSAARIALAGVGETPLRASAAEALLLGETLGPEAIAAAAEAAAAASDPPDDLHGSAAYRRHLAAVLTRRALAAAARALP